MKNNVVHNATYFLVRHTFACLSSLVIIFYCAYLPAQQTTIRKESIETIKTEKIESTFQALSLAYAGDPTKSGVLFIHGTPGDWSAFENYLNNSKLQQMYFMVSVDRPGWGDSSLGIGSNFTDFEFQAKAISQVFRRFPNKRWIVVGHSYGASLAPQLALNNPEYVSNLLLLAGSLKPELGKPRWFNNLAKLQLVKWLIPASFEQSNAEIMALQGELQELEIQLQGRYLDIKVTHIQGAKDKLVSPKNHDYTAKNWPSSFSSLNNIFLSNDGHLLPWKREDLVLQTLTEMDTEVAQNKELCDSDC